MAGYWDQEPGPLLVLGLGNPGPEYAGSRHNMGFAATSRLADRHGLALTKSGHRSRWDKGRVRGTQVILAQPQTYMNHSGEAARSLADYFGVPLHRLLAVHDDLDLELGRLKVSLGGGSGGHKGVASLITHLGGEGFGRLRVGIGRPRFGEPVEQFVLTGFYADQKPLVAETVLAATDCLELIISEGPQAAMQRFHRLPSSEEVEG
ncbi:MAG: aminoacyl-tRNA hydrolase [Desulfarculus sp.]|jgi:PTH1 family peptidyl-tRNA hydrolase|nr:MAG: aminoacyl-tRNA hydrolase [Desulfarculus sp.]